jgi:hypothetical protein
MAIEPIARRFRERLSKSAGSKADAQADDRGKKIEEVDYGGSVLIVERHEPAAEVVEN